MSSHTCSDRPLPLCKTCIVVTASIFTLFKANTKEAAKEVWRPKAAPPLLLATFALAFNTVNIVAGSAILVLHAGKTGRRTVGRTPLGLHVPSWCETPMDDQDKTESHY